MTMSTRRHLLSIADLSTDNLMDLVRRSAEYAVKGPPRSTPLRGIVVGVYFRRTSTRTRTAFSVAAHRLGADVIAYGPHDLQENTGETVSDTGRVLSSMLDVLVARTADDPAELRAMAAEGGMAVINAMTSDEHPTQAIADLSTLFTLRGSLDGLRLCYLGEGNNTATALALAMARVPGAVLQLFTPRGYGLPEATLAAARRAAIASGALIEEEHDLTRLPDRADIVYTTRWQTTGTVKPDPHWRRDFLPFRVTRDILDRMSGARFMHDLPAHRGEEVDGDVLDGDRSIAFVQAQHKLYSAMAVLDWTAGGTR
jgi:ornithine carbamoyltransferase